MCLEPIHPGDDSYYDEDDGDDDDHGDGHDDGGGDGDVSDGDSNGAGVWFCRQWWLLWCW